MLFDRAASRLPAGRRRRARRRFHRRCGHRRARRLRAPSSSSPITPYATRRNRAPCARAAADGQLRRRPSGTYVNLEGRWQSVRRRGEAGRRVASGLEDPARARQPARLSPGFEYQSPKRCATNCARARHAQARKSGRRLRGRMPGRLAPLAASVARLSASTRSTPWCAARRRCRPRAPVANRHAADDGPRMFDVARTEFLTSPPNSLIDAAGSWS